ncbi:Rav2p NDAI_0G02130 [Naumovozyma dairenensis CBS 421]|uniref:Regulator of V-ATPase in vacuolar membrane protein 2 n=1 Tax=Naumovozyma dairenensis (strain ATCC 10597 / BCRC 20456 / CBS 421 / NBRC 0211 / NRRL Y-12639) TaxID=1071378 RepID=G0WDX7_NAUDC|nr:hypothetical protein NDAI_0G02130 [Naumovozyma dairenensis CBS 421]CCD25988.2 hypothetical protein NDAI_0G02130 [Naumovozyma dairenensis CBS 421]
MTTQLYPNDYFGGVENFNSKSDHAKERHWLINEIIKPELPNIIDNVEKCLAMLNSDQIFKMPISNTSANATATTNKNMSTITRTVQNDSSTSSSSSSAASTSNNCPSIRGIITRRGGYILDFQAMVKFNEFKKGKQILFRMNTGKNYPLLQIKRIHENMEHILQLLEDLQLIDDILEFIKKFGTVLNLLNDSTDLLTNPPEQLIFPYNNNEMMKEMFQDSHLISQSTHHEISLELVLFKNEISIDFRNLEKVTKKPWCEIDPQTGKSLTDKVKDELKSNRSKNLTDILKSNGVQLEQPSLLNNLMMSTFNTETTTLQQAQKYLSRCVTFDNKVVMELEKIAITTSDPTLISISAKLTALEGSISNHYTNLTIEECPITNE